MDRYILCTMYRKFCNYISLISGEEKAAIPLQIRYGLGVVWNYIKYRATISDYFELGFYMKRSIEKEEYLTSKKGLYFAERVDSLEKIMALNSKKAMYSQLKDYIKREQVFTSEATYEEFVRFARGNEKFLYKPDVSDCGKGIEVWYTRGADLEQLWEKAKEFPAVLDAFVEQHHKLKQINPSSVNTIRIFTLMIGGTCNFIGAALRMGNGNAVIDNYSAGGLVGAIDMKTGIIIDDAEDCVGRRYAYHPISKIKMKGFQVPRWADVLRFVEECAKLYELRYVAWDIAVREEDCVLIEANPNGMANVIQIAGAGGRKKQFDDLLRQFVKQKKEGK